jgi:arginine decarboxylase
MYVPGRIFLTRGVGVHKEKLASFEEALRKAQIAKFNLVHVSSIFPPHCKLVSREEGLKTLKPGHVVHTVMSRNATNENRRLIAASVGIAIPANPDNYGYLSEYHSFGETGEKAGDYAEDLAASMLSTILGLDYDQDASYDEKKELWKISSQIVRTTNVTQSAVAAGGGVWTTVLAAAVLLT